MVGKNMYQRLARYQEWRRWCTRRVPPPNFYRLQGTLEQQVRSPGWIRMQDGGPIDVLLSDLILVVEAALLEAGWDLRRPLVGSPYWVKGAVEYHCNGTTVWDAPVWPCLDNL